MNNECILESEVANKIVTPSALLATPVFHYIHNGMLHYATFFLFAIHITFLIHSPALTASPLNFL